MPITEWVRRDRLPQASPLSLRRHLRAATQPGSADGCGVLSTTVPFSASVLVPTAASAPRIRAQQKPSRRSSGGHAACGGGHVAGRPPHRLHKFHQGLPRLQRRREEAGKALGQVLR